MVGFLKFALGVVMVIAGSFGIYAMTIGDFNNSFLVGNPRIIIGVVSFVILLGGIYILRRKA